MTAAPSPRMRGHGNEDRDALGWGGAESLSGVRCDDIGGSAVRVLERPNSAVITAQVRRDG